MAEILTDDDLQKLKSAQRGIFRSPIPTHDISNGEFMPGPQSENQKRLEARIKDLSGTLARKHGMRRREFLRTASGMAAAFVAMNEVYGRVFGVSEAEAAIPEKAEERAARLSKQFIFDDHSHFLRPDAGPNSPLRRFVNIRKGTARSGKNPAIGKVTDQTYDDLMFENYVKEMFLDSDTKLAIVSGAPSEKPEDWFLTNDMKAEARARVNRFAGSKRLYSHAVFAPGSKGWIEEMDRSIELLKPDSWKGYTIGDNTHKDLARPWRLDDEKLVYPAYEKMLKAGIRNVCIHKGLLPLGALKRWGHLEPYAKVDDVGKAAKDWPDLNFLIYHSGYQHIGGGIKDAVPEFNTTGRISWISDLAEIPEKYDVSNVYGDLGATFATAAVSHPQIAAAMLGILIRGLGADRVVWGTDSLWYGSPQWQIEAFRRLEIPEDMQKKHGFAPLGPDDGLVKSAILGFNSARLYNVELEAAMRNFETDRLAQSKARYNAAGPARSNKAYGYVLKDRA